MLSTPGVGHVGGIPATRLLFCAGCVVVMETILPAESVTVVVVEPSGLVTVVVVSARHHWRGATARPGGGPAPPLPAGRQPSETTTMQPWQRPRSHSSHQPPVAIMLRPAE